uniref:Fe2OG dioxygenase domain-containing protein n=1 Tax=Haptolina ericina TaxID=156174 RepID=A0A7S3AUA4_9EUKA
MEAARASNVPSAVPIRLERGHALLHPGSVRHGGAPIVSGVRYVLVLFLMDTLTVEYDRYYTEMAVETLERAQALSAEGEEGEVRRRLVEESAALFADACAAGAKVDDGRDGGMAVIEAFRALDVELELN